MTEYCRNPVTEKWTNASYDTQGYVENYSNLDPHGIPFSRLLYDTQGCGGPILTRIERIMKVDE